MRDLLKKILIGIALFIVPSALADEYKVLVIPDNIVTENIAVDSFIYNASAEFFADDIITLLNSTDYINSPSVSEIRNLYKQDPSAFISAKNFTNKFRTNYNIDYLLLKKLAKKAEAKYALVMTSYIDAENYVLRRTIWDFLNIPGATVVDPAYKISTYVALVDTEKNAKLWSDTYYKTISTCENRIITRGTSPQTEQLQKIKDYSKYISPQIAQSVQQNILPDDILAKESKSIEYGISDIDNVFTKKYRHYTKETNKFYNQKKSEMKDFADNTKDKYNDYKENRKLKKQKKLDEELKMKMDVKATPVFNDELKEISNKKQEEASNLKNSVYQKKSSEIDYPELIEIEIKKQRKKNFYGTFNLNRPELRDYN